MISYALPTQRRLYLGYSLPVLSSSSQRQAVLSGGVGWLSRAGNNPPLAPYSLTCDDLFCSGHYNGTIALACSGSTDPENDTLSYVFEARLPDANATPSGWWDANWGLRVPITVTNSGSTPLTDYTVRLDLNFQNIPPAFWSTASDDGSDFRFVQGSQVLPYFVESVNLITYSGTVHVVVPSIPVGTSTFYFYWGNPAAVSQSSLASLSHLVIHDGSDVSGWSQSQDSGAPWQTDGNFFTNASSIGTQYIGKLAPSGMRKAPVSWFRVRVQSGSDITEVRAQPYSNTPNFPEDMIVQVKRNNLTIWKWEGGPICGNVSLTPGLHDIFVSRGLGTWRAIVDGQYRFQCTDTSTKEAPFYTVHSHAGNSFGYVDYWYHRKTAAVEPILTAGAIEPYAPPLAWISIGSHAPAQHLLWDTLLWGNQANVALRCAAVDMNGSGLYSPYFQSPLNISFN